MGKDLDSKLYNEYFEGKKEIFDLLYSKYKSKIEFFVFNIVKDYQRAEDITQDVFIYVFQNQSKENYSFKNYLYFVAKSRAISYIETEKRREEITEKYIKNEGEAVESDIAEFISCEETKKELIDAINELEDKYKNAVYLTQIEELSYKETSQILGETIQNTKNLVHRGKKELRKNLVAKGFYKNSKLSKLLITILCVGLFLSGITFAEEIRLIVHNLTQNIFGTYNEGITTAIDNSYEAQIDMKYVLSNGIKAKIDSVMLDDYNLSIVFNILVENNEFLKKLDVSKIEFDNLLIMDENNNILHADYKHVQEFIDFCEDNNFEKGEFYTGCSNGGSTRKVFSSENNNKFLVSELISSKKIPESKVLHIKFDTIYFLNSKAYAFALVNGFEDTPKSQCRTITGNWEFEVDLEEIYEKRNTIEYEVVNINDNRTEVIEASLSMSNMRLELITNTKKIDFEKMQNRNPKTMNVFDMLAFNELYIENENGEKFYEVGSEGTGFEMIEPGKIRYHALFNYTYFDRTENIKIHLRTNKKEELIIEMKMKDETNE